MDWKGQTAAEFVMRLILAVTALLGLLLGWWMQDVSLVFKVSLGGCALGMLAVVPDWPWWNRHRLQWRNSGPSQK
jgi:signal peptidase complex subunit 1